MTRLSRLASVCLLLLPAWGWAAAPVAPTGLTIAAVRGTEVGLQWTDNSGNETAFAIWRKVGAGTYVRVAVVAPNDNDFTDRSLIQGTTYSYRVRATNNEGASAWTNEVTATTLALPGAPSFLFGRIQGPPHTVTLTWLDGSNNETAFAIWRRVEPFDWTRIGVVPPNTPYFIDRDVTSGATYSDTRFVPLSVDQLAFRLGQESSFALSATASQHFWRVFVPNVTPVDFEQMVLDGVPGLVNYSQTITLDPNTVAVAAQIARSITRRLAIAQSNPTYGLDTVFQYHPDNPRLLFVPLVENLSVADYSVPTQARVVGVATFWVTGVSQSELRGSFVAVNTSPPLSGSPRIHYRVRATNNYGASPWCNEIIWQGWGSGEFSYEVGGSTARRF